MILLDVPGPVLVPLSFRFRGLQEIGGPVLGFSVSPFHPEHPDEPVLAEVDHSSFRWDLDLGDRAVVGMIRIHQPVGLEAGEPVPREGSYELQVTDIRVPGVKEDTLRVKSPSLRNLEHVPEVVVIGFTILLRRIDAVIDRHDGGTIRPEGGDQVDPLDHPVVLPAPVSGDQLHLMGVRFVQGTVVDDQHSLLRADQRSRFFVERLRVGRLSLQQPPDRIMSDRSLL